MHEHAPGPDFWTFDSTNRGVEQTANPTKDWVFDPTKIGAEVRKPDPTMAWHTAAAHQSGMPPAMEDLYRQCKTHH